MSSEGSFCIRADHPCLPGHFESGSVVPGVVLLDEAFALILAAHPDRCVVGLPSVKFVRPVLPEQLVAVAWHDMASADLASAGVASADVASADVTSAPADRRIAFTCTVASQVVLRGSLQLGVVG
jgi:3-hydroxymyristoyl/3-hydroxydecanoyl-(acyl carrier protein) dehydratase